jgi:hypothetical protein
MKNNKIKSVLLSGVLAISIVGCSSAQEVETTTGQTYDMTNTSPTEAIENTATTTSESGNSELSNKMNSTWIDSAEGSILNTSDMFSNRDLEQVVNLSDAEVITLLDEQDVLIDKEGIYVLTGTASNVTVTVDVDDEAKVQIVLDGVIIDNDDAPAIYVVSGDKVFVTTTNTENSLSVTGAFVADGDNNLDAVIYSKSDIVFNGVGTLIIVSSEGNGISSKDDLKFTGGTYNIQSLKDAIEANDSIRIYDGTFNISSQKDGLHSENSDDDSLGYIYILGGTFNIEASDDGIQGNAVVQIDGGVIDIPKSTEGIEGTTVQINGGSINIYASDDGINASDKSTSYDIMIEVNGGTINVVMASGDTDGFDANGDIYINGGTISVQCNSAFDADGIAELNGGDVTVNGSVITEIVQQQMGGRGKGDRPAGDRPTPIN